MKYFVVVQQNVTRGEVAAPEECDGPDEVHHQEVARLVLCEDTRAVANTLHACRNDEDWCVFELVDGHAVRRAVQMVRDVVIS